MGRPTPMHSTTTTATAGSTAASPKTIGRRQTRRCGYSAARRWIEWIFEFWTTPSRISIALLVVSFPSRAVGPAITSRRKGRTAELISRVRDAVSPAVAVLHQDAPAEVGVDAVEVSGMDRQSVLVLLRRLTKQSEGEVLHVVPSIRGLHAITSVVTAAAEVVIRRHFPSRASGSATCLRLRVSPRVPRDRLTPSRARAATRVAWVWVRSGSGQLEGGRVDDRLDVAIHDVDVLAEIEMMTNLIIATSESDKPLSQRRIDEILGVVPSIPRARQP